MLSFHRRMSSSLGIEGPPFRVLRQPQIAANLPEYTLGLISPPCLPDLAVLADVPHVNRHADSGQVLRGRSRPVVSHCTTPYNAGSPPPPAWVVHPRRTQCASSRRRLRCQAERAQSARRTTAVSCGLAIPSVR